jgi:hypothetical protein
MCESVSTAIPRVGFRTSTRNMTDNCFPPGWDEARVRRVMAHYESQSEEEAVAEDEAASESPGETLMIVPKPLVPAVRELIAKHRRDAGQGRG